VVADLSTRAVLIEWMALGDAPVPSVVGRPLIAIAITVTVTRRGGIVLDAA
jgi:hypothetical protein